MLDKIGRSKWFWIGLGIFVVCAILFDLIVVNYWAVRKVITGNWDPRLLIFGAFILMLDLIPHLSKDHGKTTKKYRRLLFILLMIWSVTINGFWRGLLFAALITVVSRIIGGLVFFFRKTFR